MDKLLQVKALAKKFSSRGREIAVFADVSFDLALGETCVITGRSGVGKSTLLGIISGFDRQTAGTVIFEGKKLEQLSLSQLCELRAGKIGMIFQSFNLINSWSALENVEAVLMHRGISPTERRQRAKAALEQLGLKDRMANYPVELSVGQQQRVAVARTLVNDPTLILADEPTGDVDSETADEIMELVLPNVRSGKAALLVATHGAFNLKYADKILKLHDGTLRQISPEDASGKNLDKSSAHD